MNNESKEIHIELNFLDFNLQEDSKIKLYKLVQAQRSSSFIAPEVMMAVIIGGSLIVRQFIYSLFDYLKSREEVVLKIKLSKKEHLISNDDREDEQKIKEIVKDIMVEEKKISVTKINN